MSNADLIRELRARAYEPYVPGYLVEAAADALAAHEWNTDMDAAPRDGTAFLVGSIPVRDEYGGWKHWLPFVVFNGYGKLQRPATADLLPYSPTHWMPLPVPPDNRTGKE